MRKWRLLAAVSLVAPGLVFGYAGLASYRAIEARTTERIARALDAIQDEVLGAFQLIRRTIADANNELRGLSDDQIRANEPRLSLRLKDLQGARPQMEAIWVFDRGGWALVSSTVLPVLRDVSNADRDYFRAHIEQRAPQFSVGR
jgi:two-component system, NtrC family, sensor kinase